MITELEGILSAEGHRRQELIAQLQERVWDSSDRIPSPEREILDELAYDLSFFEPDDELRAEDAVYFGVERLHREITTAIARLRDLHTTSD
jgi:hypothetical protein